MNRLWLYLLMLIPALVAAAPQVLVRGQLLGADTAVVGGQVTLQVDLLVDTWFSAPPELPTLQLPGAVVLPPSGEAVHLNETHEATKFFGLRFNYRIIPQSAQAYVVPALSIIVHRGQSDNPVTVATAAQPFRAAQPGGASSTDGAWVADEVEFVQTLELSHTPLRPGDTITRILGIRAPGAQAMLIPAPAFAAVDGLSLAVQPATVHPLGDGRGGMAGGARDDAARYRVLREGVFQLPAISLRWWSTTDRQMHTVSVPQVAVEARGQAYAEPFAVDRDLRQLRRDAPLRIGLHSGLHWPLGLLLAGLVLALAYRARRWLPTSQTAWQRWRAELARRAQAYRLKPLNPRQCREVTHDRQTPR